MADKYEVMFSFNNISNEFFQDKTLVETIVNATICASFVSNTVGKIKFLKLQSENGTKNVGEIGDTFLEVLPFKWKQNAE